MRIRNQSGTVLVVTMGFVTVFTLLGMASIHHAMSEHKAVEARKASMQAFWLADGAVERARAELPLTRDFGVNPISVSNHSKGAYDFDTNLSDGRKYEWKVQAYGKVRGEQRNIVAYVSNKNLPDYAVTSNKVLSALPSFLTEGEVAHKPDLDIEKTFGVPQGQTYKSICTDGVVEITVGSEDIPADAIKNVACLDINTNDELITIPEQKSESTILIIDATKANEKSEFPTNIDFAGDINGIVYVVGETTIGIYEDTQINGSVFLEGNSSILALKKVGGVDHEGDIQFDGELVDKASALSKYADFLKQTAGLTVKNWKEVGELDKDI